VADRADELRLGLASLLAEHCPTLSDGERTELADLEQRGCWRPGRRPTRPDPVTRAFLDFFDGAEQEELAYGSLAAGTTEELRVLFREGLSAGPPGSQP
jgi:hypothetical protein